MAPKISRGFLIESSAKVSSCQPSPVIVEV